MERSLEILKSKKFEKSLEPIWSKGQRSKKDTYFRHLILYNLGLRIFQENYPAQTMGPIVPYTHAKNWEDL